MDIISENDGKKYCSNKHYVFSISRCNDYEVDTSVILLQITLKNKHSLVIVYLICDWKISQIAIGNNCCIYT